MHDGILVLIDTEDGARDLVSRAGRLAVETRLPVTLLSVVTTEGYERRRRAMQSIRSLATWEYSLDQALEGARLRTDRLGIEELAPLGVEYTTVVRLTDRLDTLSDLARQFPHVVVSTTTGGWLRRRPRLGRLARALTRRFDGELTLVDPTDCCRPREGGS